MSVTFRKRLLWLLLASIAVLLFGCGRQPVTTADSSSSPAPSPSFTDARLLRATSGNAIWILSSSDLQSVNTKQVGGRRQLPSTGDARPSLRFVNQTDGWLSALVAG